MNSSWLSSKAGGGEGARVPEVIRGCVQQAGGHRLVHLIGPTRKDIPLLEWLDTLVSQRADLGYQQNHVLQFCYTIQDIWRRLGGEYEHVLKTLTSTLKTEEVEQLFSHTGGRIVAYGNSGIRKCPLA